LKLRELAFHTLIVTLFLEKSSDEESTKSSEIQSSEPVSAPVRVEESILKQSEDGATSDISHSPEFASELYLDNDRTIISPDLSL
jgi:hypothetical protein